MSPILAYHQTSRAHREGIQAYGLLGNRPTRSQPWGVYVFHEDFHHVARHWTWWTHGLLEGEYDPNDLWHVAYIGPIAMDTYVLNGWILLEAPVEHVTLVTSN